MKKSEFIGWLDANDICPPTDCKNSPEYCHEHWAEFLAALEPDDEEPPRGPALRQAIMWFAREMEKQAQQEFINGQGWRESSRNSVMLIFESELAKFRQNKNTEVDINLVIESAARVSTLLMAYADLARMELDAGRKVTND